MSEKEQSKSRQSSASRKIMSEEEKIFQKFCKQMLQTKVFRGNYQERRRVNNLNDYRDLIVIDRSERELIKDLEYIRSRIINFYNNYNKYEDKKQGNINLKNENCENNLWIGITLPEMVGAPAAGVCIWTEISDLPFGNHWFYIRTVKFRLNEVIIKVQPVISSDDDNGASSKGFKSNDSFNDSNDNVGEGNESNSIPSLSDFTELFTSWKNGIIQNLLEFLSQDVNKENIVKTLKFIALIFLSLMTFSIEAIKFLGIFSLRFMAECRLWIHTCAPIILKIIELITKTIGGFYILIAMFWKDSTGGNRRPESNLRMLTESPESYRTKPNVNYRINGRAAFRNLHYRDEYYYDSNRRFIPS